MSPIYTYNGTLEDLVSKEQQTHLKKTTSFEEGSNVHINSEMPNPFFS